LWFAGSAFSRIRAVPVAHGEVDDQARDEPKKKADTQ
jgi:hypothetical protein